MARRRLRKLLLRVGSYSGTFVLSFLVNPQLLFVKLSDL